VKALAAVIGREEDRAAAREHVQRVEAVGRLVAEEAGRNRADLPQAEEGGDEEEKRNVKRET